MKFINLDLIYPSYSEIESVLNDQDRELIRRLDQVRLECNKEYEIFNFYNGLNQIMTSLRLINNMIQEYKDHSASVVFFFSILYKYSICGI